jgi:hypothetical protein
MVVGLDEQGSALSTLVDLRPTIATSDLLFSEWCHGVEIEVVCTCSSISTVVG